MSNISGLVVHTPSLHVFCSRSRYFTLSEYLLLYLKSTVFICVWTSSIQITENVYDDDIAVKRQAFCDFYDDDSAVKHQAFLDFDHDEIAIKHQAFFELECHSVNLKSRVIQIGLLLKLIQDQLLVRYNLYS